MSPAHDSAPPIFLGEEQIRRHLSYETLIPAMRQALIDFSAGRIQQPVRTILPVTEHRGFFATMPAVCGDVMGLKAVTFYPENGRFGVATHLATILLFRAQTGEPLAVFDARLITEMRTAAVSSVAVDLLAAPGAHRLAILGSGVQARSHLAAFRQVRYFDDVRVWSRTAEHATRFAREHGVRAASIEDAVAEADVVLTATSAQQPILEGRLLKPSAMAVSIGAIGPAFRELDDTAMQACLVVESRESAMRESGDVILSGTPIHAELGELLSQPGFQLPAGRAVYKSLGIAAEDIVAARLVYEAVMAH